MLLNGSIERINKRLETKLKPKNKIMKLKYKYKKKLLKINNYM